MLFNSYEFIFFYLPIVFFGFFRIARSSRRIAALWLALVSLVFYGWWNPKFVVLLLLSIAFNYAMAYVVGHLLVFRGEVIRAKTLLVAAIIVNLTLLGYFKYANFFIGSINHLVGTEWSLSVIILPLGISFFTFTQIAFLVDTYRGIAREYDFIHYVLFVTYFPHLIAGPVLHHKQMMPQFNGVDTYQIDFKNIAIGLTLFTIGLTKKTLLGDNIAPFANAVFGGAHNNVSIGFFEAWAGVLAYTLQIYFDFSGYSDMALGLSLFFNIYLPFNFDSPYRTANIIDFWRCWHMTLSTFLKEYVYIPLGGSRLGVKRQCANVLATMVLGGLWHGASWTFVMWGGLHSIFLIVNHAWRSMIKQFGYEFRNANSLYKVTSWAINFSCIMFAWVFFRAETFGDAFIVIRGLIGLNGISIPESILNISMLNEIVESNKMHVTLAGFFPEIVRNTGMETKFVVQMLALGLGIVLFFPNSQQIVRIQPVVTAGGGIEWGNIFLGIQT